MADPTAVSIRDRIASLQIDQVHVRQPPLAPKPPPVKPPLPSRLTRTASANAEIQALDKHSGNLPNGQEHPPAPIVIKKPPSLPPRPPSRTSSNVIPTAARSGSVSSATSALSKTYSISTAPTSPTPSLEPRLAKTPSLPSRKQSEPNATGSFLPAPQPVTVSSTGNTPARKSALLLGFGGSTTPPVPSKPAAVLAKSLISQRKTSLTSPPLPTQTGSSSPPPIPLHSRPKPSTTVSGSVALPAQTSGFSVSTACLICRDFSGPDSHAARFPREAIPSKDPAWLSYQLTSPFESRTDKARVIFSWLHHNVAYNTEAFFSGNRQPPDASYVIEHGLAVCEGYAGAFNTLALHAGLESIVIGGASKGYGFKTVQPGEPLPPFKHSHAWNAVRIDGGEWKLIDSCWGAGALADRAFKKGFDSKWFTMPNNEFAQRHYPAVTSMLFRTDGRAFTYEEYIVGADGPGDNVTVYGGLSGEHGFAEAEILPRKKNIPARGNQVVRFQFQKLCEHWDNARHGKGRPYLFMLGVHGVDGRKDDNIPFNTNGSFWWVDVPVRELGAPGQKVTAWAVKSKGPRDGRGFTVVDYKAALNKGLISFGGVASWELV